MSTLVTGQAPAGKAKAIEDIAVPALRLRSASVTEHCEALRHVGKTFFWWYMGLGPNVWNFSVPFRDAWGRWWYNIKPGLSWPVDVLTPIEGAPGLPLPKKVLGYQHVTAGEGNSHLRINVINDISCYGPQAINSKRRNSVRKGASLCELSVMKSPDEATFAECAFVWNDFRVRTNWKYPVSAKRLSEGWRRLMDVPGATIIVGRGKTSGQVAGFLITKVIGEVAYVDTIASATGMLKTNINDILIYGFVMNAKALEGVRKAHFAIVSYDKQLEFFKRGVGFFPYPFPAWTELNPLFQFTLGALHPSALRRMVGQFE